MNGINHPSCTLSYTLPTHPPHTQTYHYPSFNLARDEAKVAHEVRHNLTRPTAWEAVMRIRTSKGLRISSFHGHFFNRCGGVWGRGLRRYTRLELSEGGMQQLGQRLQQGPTHVLFPRPLPQTVWAGMGQRFEAVHTPGASSGLREGEGHQLRQRLHLFLPWPTVQQVWAGEEGCGVVVLLQYIQGSYRWQGHQTKPGLQHVSANIPNLVHMCTFPPPIPHTGQQPCCAAHLRRWQVNHMLCQGLELLYTPLTLIPLPHRSVDRSAGAAHLQTRTTPLVLCKCSRLLPVLFFA